MEEFIIGAIIVVLIGVLIILRTKKKRDEIDPPHSPLH
jgi:hypothetical protein